MTSTRVDHPRSGELPPPRTETLADDVFAYIQPDGGWWINNTGFVVGDRSVLYIDSCATERRTRAFVAAVDTVLAGLDEAVPQPPAAGRRRSGDRARMLVNTHQHGDHTNGNCVLPGTTIIGHDLCREAIMQTGILHPEGLWEPVEWGELDAAPPFVTFVHRLDVHVDDLKVELHHFGTAAHTTNDVVAWIPEHRVVFTGDLVFNGGTPFVLMGSVAGSLVALDCIAELDADVLVPGHGDVCGPQAIDVMGGYLRWLQDVATDATDAGLSPLEASRRADLGPFSSLAHPERLAGNLRRAMAECEGARPGDPIDIVAALGDMVALNDGKPLTCHA
jgi:cyclase